jgi:hypothetical protein
MSSIGMTLVCAALLSLVNQETPPKPAPPRFLALGDSYPEARAAFGSGGGSP